MLLNIAESSRPSTRQSLCPPPSPPPLPTPVTHVVGVESGAAGARNATAQAKRGWTGGPYLRPDRFGLDRFALTQAPTGQAARGRRREPTGLSPQVADKSLVSEQAVSLAERLEGLDVAGRAIHRQASVPGKLLDPVLEEGLQLRR